MTNINFVRGAALLFSPMILASCGGSSEPPPEEPPVLQSLIKNSPDEALAGCTVDLGSCNQTVVRSGVIVKKELDRSLRFFTVTDNEDTTYTYSDGEDDVVITQQELDDFNNLNIIPDGFDFQLLSAAWGQHTDASVIPVGGTALYEGTAGYHTQSHLYDDDGTAFLSVDFGAGTANLSATFPGYIKTILVPNMLIDGYSFTGDEVELYDALGPIDLTGANSQAASAGMFFEAIDGTWDVPEWFGAVAVREGDDDAIWLNSIGAAISSADIIPAD